MKPSAKILTAAEMAAADKRTAEQGTPLLTLMENAGAAVAAFILRQHAECERIAVICGKGNNGGDGAVAARLLAARGKRVLVVLLAEESSLRGEAGIVFQRLHDQAGVEVLHANDEITFTAAASWMNDYDLVVDALLGTGFAPPLRGIAVAVKAWLAESTIPVVAVDLPSGWDADSMVQESSEAFRADAVVTFTAPKMAHIFGNLTGTVFGPIVVAKIGSPEEAVVSKTQLSWAGVAKSLAEKPRPVNSNKGKFGHVLVIGGAWGKAGAPAMSSLAALRTGAGLVTAAVPESIVESVARITPELMLAPLDETYHAHGDGGTVSISNLEGKRLAALIHRKTVVAIGPGLSTEKEASAFVRGFVEKTTMPLVLDADALNAFAGNAHLLDGDSRTLVLTPHPGEMATLLGTTVKEVEADRINIARAFATKHRVTLVLKGWRTLIAHPDGSIAVNTTGNPAMAKGGSGDILTGIVAAMLAQYPENVAEAVNAAVYLHGLAGDFAVHAQNEHTVLATDTVAHLADAFNYSVTDEDGLVWLSGLRA